MRKNNTAQNVVKHDINERIRPVRLRLITELENNDFIKGEIYNKNDLLEYAYSQGLDLVMVNPKPEHPLCEIIDYKKYIYKEKQKLKESKKSSQKNKEIRFKIDTDDHDMKRFLNNTLEWTTKGFNVKITLNFKGKRDMREDRKNMAMLKILKFVNDLGEDVTIVQEPKMEGKRIIAKVKKK